MERYFVNYNQALALKELGFDESSLAYYDGWNGQTDLIITDENPKFLTKLFNLFSKNKYSSYTQDYVEYLGGFCIAPLKSQVFEWFREKHNLRHNVMDFIDDVTGIEWDYEIATIGTDLDEMGKYIPLVDYSIDDETRKFKTYEEAESDCIDKLIELIKNK